MCFNKIIFLLLFIFSNYKCMFFTKNFQYNIFFINYNELFFKNIEDYINKNKKKIIINITVAIVIIILITILYKYFMNSKNRENELELLKKKLKNKEQIEKDNEFDSELIFIPKKETFEVLDEFEDIKKILSCSTKEKKESELLENSNIKNSCDEENEDNIVDWSFYRDSQDQKIDDKIFHQELLFSELFIKDTDKKEDELEYEESEDKEVKIITCIIELISEVEDTLKVETNMYESGICYELSEVAKQKLKNEMQEEIDSFIKNLLNKDINKLSKEEILKNFSVFVENLLQVQEESPRSTEENFIPQGLYQKKKNFLDLDATSPSESSSLLNIQSDNK